MRVAGGGASKYSKEYENNELIHGGHWCLEVVVGWI
jgi:hypothetical protein